MLILISQSGHEFAVPSSQSALRCGVRVNPTVISLKVTVLADEYTDCVNRIMFLSSQVHLSIVKTSFVMY